MRKQNKQLEIYKKINSLIIIDLIGDGACQNRVKNRANMYNFGCKKIFFVLIFRLLTRMRCFSLILSPLLREVKHLVFRCFFCLRKLIAGIVANLTTKPYCLIKIHANNKVLCFLSKAFFDTISYQTKKRPIEKNLSV